MGDNSLQTLLLDLHRPLLVIPSLAIHLDRAGIRLAIITGRNSEIVAQRAANLGIALVVLERVETVAEAVGPRIQRRARRDHLDEGEALVV